MRVVWGMVFHGLADWVRLPANQASIDPAALDEFAHNLTDCVVSSLATPTSTPSDRTNGPPAGSMGVRSVRIGRPWPLPTR